MTKPGMAVVFVQTKARPGCEKDLSVLIPALEACGFKVIIHQNLSAKETKQILHVVKDQVLHNYSGLIVVSMSHGLEMET